MLLVIMIAALWGCPGQMQAQGVDVRPLEGEVFLGTSAPLFGYHGGKSKLGTALGLELRCNVEDSPVDVGVLLDITSQSVNTRHAAKRMVSQWGLIGRTTGRLRQLWSATIISIRVGWSIPLLA
ncbi:hypothetical protein [Hoylesella enoeca]|uniref:hypothetical protein n=1 Tax=Hoylesella enoeca TaxID=76123 RepID=UPI0011DD4487|nr:hypothetical protein [Hoylesella enoeca]